MMYLVKEVMYTLQGEGAHAGQAAVFVRFAGCCLWSGKAEHRERDATRNGAQCPVWCDTDFVGGTPMTAEQVGQAVEDVLPDGVDKDVLVVFTGGEPLLQLDKELTDEVLRRLPDVLLALETNGTLDWTGRGIDFGWVCVSPKVPRDRLHPIFTSRGACEVKVVYPDHDPGEYRDIPAQHYWVSPRADPVSVGRSLLNTDHTAQAIEFCKQNPEWRLSIQGHKVLGIP